MKTFSTLTAAAALLTLALSTPAQACPLCSGIKLNGIQFNGFRINGVQFNTFRLNGMRINGWRVNGLQFNGNGQPLSGQVFAVTLPEGQLTQ